VPLADRLAVLLVLAAVSADAAPPATPPAEWLVEQVKTLAAPEMEGRASGTPGADRAAAHIAAEMQRAGLTPGGEGGWQQSFTVPTGIKLGDGTTLRITAPAQKVLALGSEFVPLTVSADGGWEGDLVFAGFGITAPDLRYDDYAGIDVRGKIVLVMTGEPRGRDPTSPFRKPEAYHYSERRHKVINAREHGAAGVLLVAHPERAGDTLPSLTGLGQPWSIFALAVSRAAADALLSPTGVSLAAADAAIEAAAATSSIRGRRRAASAISGPARRCAARRIGCAQSS